MPSEPLTLERLKELHLQLTAILPRVEDLCPNPADIHPETFSALQQMCEESPKDYSRPYSVPFSGVQVHVRTDVEPGTFHSCTCRKKE